MLIMEFKFESKAHLETNSLSRADGMWMGQILLSDRNVQFSQTSVGPYVMKSQTI